MNSSVNLTFQIGARHSRLSQAQVKEVLQSLNAFHPHVQFAPVWIETTGDRDLSTSLRSLEKTDFFTKEIDERLLRGDFRIAIHSAKDLPEPLTRGLQIVALTKGVDPSDSLVLHQNRWQTLNFCGHHSSSSLNDHSSAILLEYGPPHGRPNLNCPENHQNSKVAPDSGVIKDHLPLGARIGTSSLRREENIKALRPDLVCADIRGTIESRLEQLDAGLYDGVVIAEAALIRLELTHRQRIALPGASANLQGQLAVVARDGDDEMVQLFSVLDTR